MTVETKSNLSQIFRQHNLKPNVDSSNHHEQNDQVSALKPFSLRTSVGPFVANNPYALQLDEII